MEAWREVKRGKELFEGDLHVSNKRAVIKHAKLPTKLLLNANSQVKDK